MRLLLLLFPALTLLAIACGGNDDSGGDTPPTATPTPEFTGCRPFSPLSPDTHTIRISKASGTTASLIITLADDGAERGVGLSNATCLPEDSGMLFAFPIDSQTTFQMRETELPLSIAFIQADGEIVSIQDMTPLSGDVYSSPAEYRYAIEVAQGWYAENGVAVGDVAEIDPLFSENAR